jgi:hypothetical protein
VIVMNISWIKIKLTGNINVISETGIRIYKNFNSNVNIKKYLRKLKFV